MSCSLQDILDSSRPELKKLFEAEFSRVPPPRMSIEFMRQNLAWNHQARKTGKDPLKYRAALTRKLEKLLAPTRTRQHLYRSGTRLVRQWQGKLYEVTILEDGYEWKEKRYRSLSQIATEITGTRWSGPRFFGLTKERDDVSA